MKNKILIIIVSYIIIYLIGIFSFPIIQSTKEKTLKGKIIYEVVIDTEYINLRKNIDLTEEPIKKVYKGEIYSVIEYYEGNSYNWYKVIYDENKTGWIASGKIESWVIIKNNRKEQK